MIIRIGLNGGAQLGHRPRIRRLPRQLQLRMGGLKFRRSRYFGRRAVQDRLGLIQIIHGNVRFHKARIRTRMVRFFAQNGGKGLRRVHRRPFDQHFLSRFHGIIQAVTGCLTARGLDDPIHKSGNLRLRHSTLKPIHRLALVKGIDGRDRLDLQLTRNHLRLVHIDLDHLDRTLGGGHGSLQLRPEGLAWATPGGPEIHNNRRGLARLDHIGHERGLGGILDQVGALRGTGQSQIHHRHPLNQLRLIWTREGGVPRGLVFLGSPGQLIEQSRELRDLAN
mmetsp:Transcript_122/g.375  ORF Transcript_122/g.375 Transcript_122/m.375 type:complete len:279 (+) Transcript_122:2356-3192(+)